MMGHRVFDDAVRIYAGLMITVSTFSMLLVFKDKTARYRVLALSVTLAIIVYLGHRMLWWPCETVICNNLKSFARGQFEYLQAVFCLGTLYEYDRLSMND